MEDDWQVSLSNAMETLDEEKCWNEENPLDEVTMP